MTTREQTIEAEAKQYVNNHVQNPEYFDILPDTSPKNLNAYCERCFIAGVNSSTVKNLEREVERLKGLIGYAHQIGFSRGRTQNGNIESSWQQFKLNNNI